MLAYAPHPDGRRFIGCRLPRPSGPPAPTTRLEVVHNWFAELERLSPTQQ